MRYIKDAPVVSPISYPSRVAPLPEDRVRAEEERGGRNEELQRESRRIQEDRWRGVLRHGVKEEEEKLPFPKLIKVENTDQNNKKNVKAVYDLKEAIRLVKVGYLEHFFPFLCFCICMWNRCCILLSFNIDGFNLEKDTWP